MVLIGGMPSENHLKSAKGGKMFEFLFILIIIALLYVVFKINAKIGRFMDYLEEDTEEEGLKDLIIQDLARKRSYLEGKENRNRKRDPLDGI